jgi:hypothetical protein
MSKLAYLFLLVFVSFLASCKKDTTSQYTSIDEYLATYTTKEEIFVVNGAAGGAIATINSRIATFKPGCFKYLGGSNSYGFDVTVRVQEFQKKSDYIFNSISTQGVDQTPLRTYSGFRMRFHDYNNEVIVTTDSLSRVFFPEIPYNSNIYSYAGEVQPYNKGLLWTPGYPNFTTQLALNGGTELNIPGIFEWQLLADTFLLNLSHWIFR